MTTKSTEEAMAVLNNHYPDLIQIAREIAIDLARKNGEVHANEVRAVMGNRGIINPEEKHFWFGAVFKSQDFAWTGKYHTYTDSGRNTHQRRVMVWRLA